MSVRCSTIVWDASPCQGSELLIELALADQASDDGVTWITVERLSKKVRLSERQVLRSLRELDRLGRIQTRKAQRGRRRQSVYRLVGPGLRPVDYDRLPFSLNLPFDDLPARHMTTVSDRQDLRHDTGGSDGMTAPRARGAKEDPSGTRQKSGAARPRDEVWDALSTLFGEPTTRTAKSLRGKVTVSLREAGADGEEIAVRARRWPKLFPQATLTETALEKHWDLLASRRKPDTGDHSCDNCGVSFATESRLAEHVENVHA